VVITGLGTLTASGAGHRELASDLARGAHRATPIQAVEESNPSAIASQVAIEDLSAWIAPAAARRMSRPSRFAVAAATMALQEAGLETGVRDEALGVSMSSTFGPLAHTQRILDQIRDEGPAAASPALFTECVVNAPVSQVSISTGAQGPCTTLCGRESGPLVALARGCSDLIEGRISRSLAGACEEVTPLLHDVLVKLGSLQPPEPDGTLEIRPLDRRRRGFLLAEGATLLHLELASRAERRDARPLGRVRSWGAAFDPTASRVSWGRDPEPLARGLLACLARGGISPTEIALIVSGASGSKAGDLLEARTLRTAWGDHPLPPIVAPKAVTGEYSGAFLAAAVLALRGQIAAAPDFERDPDIDLQPRALAAPTAGPVLVSSLACGGQAAWLVLEAA
jgi:3-oxoacyl-[acyl-carrier-protein] synthase II